MTSPEAQIWIVARRIERVSCEIFCLKLLLKLKQEWNKQSVEYNIEKH